MNSAAKKNMQIVMIAIIPVLLIGFALLYKFNESAYMKVTEEDQIVEWLTVFCLALAGLLSGVAAVREHRASGRYVLFYWAFCVACILFALEEMSWGQRIFHVKSPEFFMENSDQQEINVHNVLQKRFYFKTKNLASRVLFYYGTVLPILVYEPRIRKIVRWTRIALPPVTLALGFLIAALLMRDRPTGREEELGELFFSICFVFFMVWTHMTYRSHQDQHPNVRD